MLFIIMCLFKQAKLNANEAIFEEYNEDCTKLMEVLKSLQSQKEMILQEIKLLSLKGRPLPPISPLQSQQTETHLRLSTSLSSDKIVDFKLPEQDDIIKKEANDSDVDQDKALGTDDNGNNSDDNDAEDDSSGNDNGDSEDGFGLWQL